MAFLNFFAEQLLPPLLVALGLALYLLCLSPLWPRFRLWGLAGRMALMGLSLIPACGFIPAAVLAWRDGDRAGLVMAGVATFFSIPIALWGVPQASIGLDLQILAQILAGLMVAVTIIVIAFDLLTNED